MPRSVRRCPNESPDELSTALRHFVENIKFDVEISALPDADRDWLAELVTLATRCRSYVARNSYSREIEDPGDSEGPGRMMRALTQLWSGLELIGVGHERRRELIQKVAPDSMPPARRIAFDYLASTGPAGATIANIVKTSHYSQQSVRRALEDLECHEVVVRTSGKHRSRLAELLRRVEDQAAGYRIDWGQRRSRGHVGPG